MTDAEYFREVMALQSKDTTAHSEESTVVLNTRLYSTIKDLDRLSSIDAVLDRFIQPELHKPESYAGRVIDEDTAREIAMIEKSGQCEDCIDELIAQNLLPLNK